MVRSFEYQGKPLAVAKLHTKSPGERLMLFTRTPMRQEPLESLHFFT